MFGRFLNAPLKNNFHEWISLRKKCLFLGVFLVRIRENTVRKNSKHGHFFTQCMGLDCSKQEIIVLISPSLEYLVLMQGKFSMELRAFKLPVYF